MRRVLSTRRFERFDGPEARPRIAYRALKILASTGYGKFGEINRKARLKFNREFSEKLRRGLVYCDTSGVEVYHNPSAGYAYAYDVQSAYPAVMRGVQK
jgi:hypothetical protein